MRALDGRNGRRYNARGAHEGGRIGQSRGLRSRGATGVVEWDDAEGYGSVGGV